MCASCVSVCLFVQRAWGARLLECHSLLRKLEAVTRSSRGAQRAANSESQHDPAHPIIGQAATVVTWFSSTDACDRRCGGDSGNLTQSTPQAARRAGDAIAVRRRMKCLSVQSTRL
jgi:hypothetical protein